MAIYDSDLNRIVVRLVYDGPGFAGKTTNVQQLHGFFTERRRGEIVTPETLNGRTQYFDWMHLEGGIVQGTNLRCQLLTVPGQGALIQRRWALLEGADVIVFVFESTPEGVEIARPMLHSLRELLSSMSDSPPPFVLQANKQDLPGALSTQEAIARLGADGMACTGATASEGIGVRETVVIAIREAANRVQTQILHDGVKAIAGHAETADELLLHLKQREGSAVDGAMQVTLDVSKEGGDASVEEVEAASLKATGLGDLEAKHPSRPPESQSEGRLSGRPASTEPGDARSSVVRAAVGGSDDFRALSFRPVSAHPEGSEQQSIGANSFRPITPLPSSLSPAPVPATPDATAFEPNAAAAQTEEQLAPTQRTDVGDTEARHRTRGEQEPPAHPAHSASDVGTTNEGRQSRKTDSYELGGMERVSFPSIEPGSAPHSTTTGYRPPSPATIRPRGIDTPPPVDPPEERIPQDSILPPLPNASVGSGLIWPSASGRAILRDLAAAGPPIRRRDLSGQHGLSDGSARKDSLIFEVGPFCAKTSRRRSYGDLDDGRADLLRLARTKTALGDLLPQDTAIALMEDDVGHHWLWTVTPWVTTLRSQMVDAMVNADEEVLAAALEGYARCVLASLKLAATKSLILDVHPSNFALVNDRVCYLDDDVAEGTRIATVGHAMLKRVEEFAATPAAIERYLLALEALFERHLRPDDIAATGIDAILAAEPARSELLREAKVRIERVLAQCQRPTSFAPS